MKFVNDDDIQLKGCRGNVYIPRGSSSSGDDDRNKNKNNLTKVEIEEEEITAESLEKCYQYQRMNYHISQLPMAPKCPDAPYLGAPVSLEAASKLRK